MKTGYIIGAILLGAGGYYAGTRWYMAKKLQYKFIGFTGQGNWTSPTVTIQLDATNPTPFSSTVNKIDGVITDTSGNVIMAIETKGKIVIAAGSEEQPVVSEVDLPINLTIAGALNALAGLISGSAGKYHFKGWVTLDYIPFPLSFDINL